MAKKQCFGVKILIRPFICSMGLSSWKAPKWNDLRETFVTAPTTWSEVTLLVAWLCGSKLNSREFCERLTLQYVLPISYCQQSAISRACQFLALYRVDNVGNTETEKRYCWEALTNSNAIVIVWIVHLQPRAYLTHLIVPFMKTVTSHF